MGAPTTQDRGRVQTSLFEDKGSSSPTKGQRKTIADFTQVFLCYFDEARGHIPLASYPDKNLIFDETAMKPIYIHSVWFLGVEEQAALDHIDLEYSDHTYLAKKFYAPTNRRKERAGSEADNTETIVLVISVPNDLSVVGSDVLKVLYNVIREKILNDLQVIVKGDIARKKPIKTLQVQQTIKEGDAALSQFYKICNESLSQTPEHLLSQISDSVIKQKALAYLMLVGGGQGRDQSLAGSTLFDQTPGTPKMTPPISVLDVNFCRDKECVEVILANNQDEDLVGAKVHVSNVQGYFEQHFFEHEVGFWFAREEIMLKFPFMKNMREYIISVDVNGKKFLNKRLDVAEIRDKNGTLGKEGA